MGEDDWFGKAPGIDPASAAAGVGGRTPPTRRFAATTMC